MASLYREGFPNLSFEGMVVTRSGDSFALSGDSFALVGTERLLTTMSAWSLLFLAASVLSMVSPALAEPRLERFRPAEPPRVSERVIEQGEWASELVFALGLSEALPEDHDETDLFGLLCAEQSENTLGPGGRMIPSDAPYRVSMQPPHSRGPNEPVRMIVSLPATALYALTVNGVGAQRWSVDRRPIGHLNASKLGVAQAPRVIPLRAGPHELSVFMAPDARIDRVELAAYRPLCIAPAEGWSPRRPLTFAAGARTLVSALGLERRLPVDGSPILVEGEGFVSASAWGGRTNRTLSVPASGGAWAIAVDSPAEFAYRAELPEPGVYSLLARIHGSGSEIWSIDGHYRVTVHPDAEAGSLQWAHVMTRHLDQGEHTVHALIPRGSGIDTLRWVKRRDSDSDYIAVLRDAGFREIGVPSQPVTQTAAYASLSNPLFTEISGRLLGRLAGNEPPPPGWVRVLESAGEAVFPASMLEP